MRKTVTLVAVLLLTACGGSERPILHAFDWVDRELVEASTGVGVDGGGGMASGESVVAFDLVDGHAVSVAAHYTDQELVSQPSGEVVDTFDVDCVSVSIHATSPGLVDTEVLAAGIRERMRLHEPDCPAA